MTVNHAVTLIRHPSGMPATTDFALREAVLEDLPPDFVQVKVDTLSIDAFIRTMLDEREGFHGGTQLGGPVVALGVGEVLLSHSDDFKPGDWVTGPLMAQTYAQMPAAALTKITPASNIPASTYLGILGMTTGITAWTGMVPVGEVEPGDSVLVSGAAGAVGSVAAQVAKARGARVIGIAGGAEKGVYLKETLGLDDAIDYKSEDVGTAIANKFPNGVDLFFDNVGGEILDHALENLAVAGRVVLCGAISQYHHMDDVRGPKNYLKVAERNGTMRGFTVDRYADRFGQATEELSTLMTNGDLKLPEHEVRGIEHFSEALITLFEGGHMGKLIVKP